MHWAKIVTRAAPLWLSWLETGGASLSGTIARRQDGTYLYRGDKRSPQEIRAEGGFRPHGHPNWADNPRAYYMHRHYAAGPKGYGAEDVEGEPADAAWETAYVSLAQDQEVAETYPGWLYEIVPTQNVLDDDLNESEVLALGGVHWSQVKRFRWQHEKDAPWQENPDYEAALWEDSPIRGITTEFPSILRPVTWVRESLWSHPGARRGAMVFMRGRRMSSFMGDFPPRFREYPPSEAFPGPREIPEESSSGSESGESIDPEEFWRFYGFESREEYVEAMTRASRTYEDTCKRDGSSCVGRALSKAGETDEEVLARVSETVAAKDFEKLAVRFGVADLAKSKAGLEVAELRARLRGYQPLSSSIRTTNLAKTAKTAGKGVLVVGVLGIYVKEVVDVFSAETSALDRVAVLSSIVPVVGCVVQAGADGARGQMDPVGTTLCVVGDVLLLSPLWPLGVLVQLTRVWWELLAKPLIDSIDDSEVVSRNRLDGWSEFCGGVERYLRSDTFADNIHRQYMTEMSAIVFKAAEAKGKMAAGALSLLKSNVTMTKFERRFMMRKLFVASRRMDDRICQEADKTKQRLREHFKQQMNNWLHQEQVTFDDKFWKTLERQAIIVVTAPMPLEAGVDAMLRMTDRMVDSVKKMRGQSQSLPVWPRGVDHLNGIVDGHFDKLDTPELCRRSEGSSPESLPEA
ncbi:hypothetical protein CP533_2836 [Ophiocordyceps camponoti-saundersi (nom. inval.)]|nr:hypothetical protein CP533_2836 [Ophiocordyceps camponoti-saundersi (nom. inval.)]